MCAPAAAVGVAQAGVGIMGAVGQNNAQQSQYAASKQQAEMQRQQMIANRKHQDATDEDKWVGEQAGWDAKKSHYSEQLYEGRDAAGRAFGAASAQEQKLFRDFSSSTAASTLKMHMAKNAGLGQRGKTAGRLGAMAKARQGEEQAMLLDNLMYGQDNIKAQKHQVIDEWAQSNRQNWKAVSIAPRAGMRSSAGTFLPGDPVKPSNTGLITGIGQSVLGGISAGQSLMPPGQGLFGGGGTPAPAAGPGLFAPATPSYMSQLGIGTNLYGNLGG